jgi:prepilin-type N-terminal cleavage/methylation domain-containing protein/prepilin-type processing-associated H-X9-DG protein
MRRDAGFTLIELLVVIAIIAILAAILFPVFARAREKARQSACLSNVKQLSLGIQMYTQDYDEFYPPAYNYGSGLQWIYVVEPYVKNDQVFQCTSFKRSSWGIGVNPQICVLDRDAPYVFRSMAEIEEPSTTMVLCCSSTYYLHRTGYVHAYVPGTACGRDPVDVDSRFADYGYKIPDFENGRHNGGNNVGYCDGHAKWMESCKIYRTDSLWDPF